MSKNGLTPPQGESKHAPLDPNLDLGFDTQDLLKLAKWNMPFGKFQDKTLIQLPEEYLFWFDKKGWPSGELGRLMQLSLELKINGLDEILRPLMDSQTDPYEGN